MKEIFFFLFRFDAGIRTRALRLINPHYLLDYIYISFVIKKGWGRVTSCLDMKIPCDMR